MKAARPQLTLVTCVLASSLAFIDGSVVNVGLPAIGRSLEAPAAGLQWVLGAYLLSLSALLLLGGSLGDRFGRRRMLVGGVTVFGVASVACGVAESLPLLVFSRFVQGVGAALLMPNSLALLGTTFEAEARGRAIGVWAAAGAATAAAAPVLGGWLIDLVGWRMIFWINIPIAALAVVMAIGFVPRDPDRKGDGQPLDGLGALLVTGGLAALTWGLVEGAGSEGSTSEALVGTGAGAILLTAFVRWEGRKGDDAMMPLALFASASFVGLTLLTLLLYGALSGLLVLLPYVLIVAGHYSATMAGAALLPLPVILAVTSPPLGSLAGRIGPRPLLLTGPLAVAVGLLAMLRVGQNASYWTSVLPALVIVSLGMGCAVAPLTTAVLAVADPSHTGAASGFNSAIARTGGLVATALLGGVLTSRDASLVAAFHTSVVVASGASVLAGASALLLQSRERSR